MRKKKQNASAEDKNGFDSLMNVHTAALENNSVIIAKMLEELASKKLSMKNKKELKAITRELNRIDKDLDELGGK